MTVEATTEAEGTGPEILDMHALLDSPDEPTEEEAEPEPAPEAKPTKGKAEPTKPEAKPAPAAKPAAGPLDDLSDLLDEKATFTPDALKKNAARVVATAKAAQELTKKAHNVWGTAEKQLQKSERIKAEVHREKQTFGAQVQQLNAAFSALRTGDAKTALEGLRQLSGRDPIAWLEELNIHIASNGKKKPKSPEILEMEARLERFEQAERAKAAHAEEQHALAFIARRHEELAATAAAAEEEHPYVAEFAADNPELIGKALADVIVHYSTKLGRKVGDLDAVRMLEKQLEHQSELSERARAKREKRTAGSEPERGTGNPSKPGQAQAPTVKGKSLSVSAQTAPTVTRELTDEELTDDSASFLPPALLNWARG
jgi:hypothetical protein